MSKSVSLTVPSWPMSTFQRGSQARLAQGAVPDELRGGRGTFREGNTLECDGLMQTLVGGFPHHARSAGTNLLMELVAIQYEGSAVHQRIGYPLRRLLCCSRPGMGRE
ncbi:MAG: hypothetical protein ACRDS0_04770 [Pseudonocardiaceae bacterium]